MPGLKIWLLIAIMALLALPVATVSAASGTSLGEYEVECDKSQAEVISHPHFNSVVAKYNGPGECDINFGAYLTHGHANLGEGSQTLLGVVSQKNVKTGETTQELFIPNYTNPACKVQLDVTATQPGTPLVSGGNNDEPEPSYTGGPFWVYPNPLTIGNQGLQFNSLVEAHNEGLDECVEKTPTPTPTSTPTATATPTRTSTPTPTSTATPTKTATPTSTPTKTPTVTTTPFVYFTPTPTVSTTSTNTPTVTVTPTKTNPSATPTPTKSPVAPGVSPVASPTPVAPTTGTGPMSQKEVLFGTAACLVLLLTTMSLLHIVGSIKKGP